MCSRKVFIASQYTLSQFYNFCMPLSHSETYRLFRLFRFSFFAHLLLRFHRSRQCFRVIRGYLIVIPLEHFEEKRRLPIFHIIYIQYNTILHKNKTNKMSFQTYNVWSNSLIMNFTTYKHYNQTFWLQIILKHWKYPYETFQREIEN